MSASSFSHLHVHTQFSLLDGAAEISKLYKKAVADNMPALAITDHGNMFGAFKFVAEAAKYNQKGQPEKIKPIVGCEFYLVNDRSKNQFTRDDRDIRYHQLFLAKNAEGYQSLIKLCSAGYTEGLYGKYPRIDKELVLKYHKGLIATTCCLGAIVPRTILQKGEKEAEQEFEWWLNVFGEDYYIELQRHHIPDQEKVNEVLLRFAKKYGVKMIASNDSHYVDRDDSNMHDILLCINTNEKQRTPALKEFGDDDLKANGTRFAFYNDEFYFKSTAEMSELFSDLPEAVDNTNEIVSKVETLQLKKDILLPNFQIPEGFATQDEYLHHLTYTGALKRYGSISPEVEERLNFELFTIKTMGFAGYFLIVAEFISTGRQMGVMIGPGRGSAAGSAVAYCIGITNIDPIKYNLLFERFLNPDRKSMPDIDTDFDDEGRQKVIDHVVEKYGKNQVAQIITFGTMAAKTSIRDVARVLDLDLKTSDFLAKLVPERPGISLDRVMNAPIEGEKGLKEKEGLREDDLVKVKKLRQVATGTDLSAIVLREALRIEGSVRNTGIHAAGIIIAPKDLTEIIPVSTSKESKLLVTQYDGKLIEDAGVIKMDLLGLKTLTIVKEAVEGIKRNHQVDLNIDEIPLDDPTTFALYQAAQTNGTFQFESDGMQKYLKELRPDKFEDLIAMNALFRPGPMQYIPNFIRRKHGREPVSYDLDAMSVILEETYGITVYQEQVMLLSQKLAGFTKGEADVLRKAMGKKQKEVLDKMKAQFLEGCKANGHDVKISEKVWTDWEDFASYAFNKSHSTCYAYLAFQTAYLKAHYPAEYMAAVLTHNLNQLDKLTFFMEECRSMGVPVLGPDINESRYPFSANAAGKIRFGLGGIKGVGEAAIEAILAERDANGPFQSVFDLTGRVPARALNKSALESLVKSGALDSMGNYHRARYFLTDTRLPGTGIERALRYGAQKAQGGDAQPTLFGGMVESEVTVPPMPDGPEWDRLETLRREKEVIGFYISGHPLEDYRFEIKQFCNTKLAVVKDLPDHLREKDVTLAAIITDVQHRVSKNGKPFGSFSVEDESGSMELVLFGEDYGKFRPFLNKESLVYIRGKIQKRFQFKAREQASGKEENQEAEEFEFKIQDMMFLSDVSARLSRKLILNIDIRMVNQESTQKISEILKHSPGQTPVSLMVWDLEKQWSVPLVSRSHKVLINSDLMGSIEQVLSLKAKVE